MGGIRPLHTTYVAPRGRRALSLLGAGAIVSLALLIAAAPAAAYRLGGAKWPSRTITYHVAAPEWKSTVREAAQLWNRSGVRIRFRPASRARARLHILRRGSLMGNLAGEATLGYARGVTKKGYISDPNVGVYEIETKGVVTPCGRRVPAPFGSYFVLRCFRGPHMWLDRAPRAGLRDPETRLSMRTTVVHELGHVLGLRHVSQSTCAVMAPEHPNTCPRPSEPWRARCRLLERDDVAGAVARYGGRIKPLATEFCDLYGAPLAPTGLQVSWNGSTASVDLAWRNTPFAKQGGVHVALGRDTCPAVGAGRTLAASAESASLPVDAAGTYCAAVWAADAFGRYSAPVTAMVDVPPPLPETDPEASTYP